MQSRAVTRILVDLQTSIRPCYSQLWETRWLHNALDCPNCTSKLESRESGTRIATQDAKIENRSRKRSQKLDGIGVGRIRSLPFFPFPFTSPARIIQYKLGIQSRKQKRKNQPITRLEHCD